MNRILFVSTIVLGTAGAGAALASEDGCNVPMSDWQPREALQQKLEQEGWKVRSIKTEDGCYEAYAVDKNGKRLEAYFDPKTFATLNRKSED